MSIAKLNPLNLVLIILLTLFACGFQTTFWFQLFGNIPSPLLWLNLFIYLILYRKSIEGILTIYGLCLILSPFTAMPISVLWVNLFIVFLLTTYVKKIVFWPSSKYFVIASFGVTLTFHLVYLISSRWLEINPAPISFFHRLLEVIFTTLTAIPIYSLMVWLDRVTQKETLPEGGGAEA